VAKTGVPGLWAPACRRPPSALRAAPRAGRKVSDEFIVPLCRGHHREAHRCGDEAAWDPTRAARALWLETHPLADNSGYRGHR
jgi:hypothetical protein